MPGTSNQIRILDNKLLEEIQELVKGWLYRQESPRELVYAIENFMNNKDIESQLNNINQLKLNL